MSKPLAVIRVVVPALVLSGLFAAAAASAAEIAPDAPVATAPPATTATPGTVAKSTAGTPAVAQTSTAAQIDAYLKASPVLVLPKDNASGVTSSGDAPPRQVHGEVDVAIGTGGYRSAYVRSDFPVGKTGTLSVAVQDTQINSRAGRYGGYGYGGGYGGGYGYGYGGPRSGQSIAIGLALGGADASSDDRCRQGWDTQRRHRLDPAFDDDGYRGRPCAGDASPLRPPQ